MKHLENFKSEYIQGIYDFLEQDADVTNFKRDLIAVAEYKKTNLHDLEAQYFEYHDLMKQELKGKIVFIFREDGYLGMFMETSGVIIKKDIDYYNKMLKTGDKVSALIHGSIVYGTIYNYFKPAQLSRKKPDEVYLITKRTNNPYEAIPYLVHGSKPDDQNWKEYGDMSWWLCNRNTMDSAHKDLKLLDDNIIPVIKVENLVTEPDIIDSLKDKMHFSLVITN